MRCVAEIIKYTWRLNAFLYWICADSIVISRCNPCVVEVHEILCLFLLTKCVYVETIFVCFVTFKCESLLCDICFWCLPVVSVSECGEHFDVFCICTWLREIVAYTWTKQQISYRVIVKFTEKCVFIVERELTGSNWERWKDLKVEEMLCVL
jgi:hypothetical protein